MNENQKAFLFHFVVFVLITMLLYPVSVMMDDCRTQQADPKESHDYHCELYRPLVASMSAEQTQIERDNIHNTLVGSMSYHSEMNWSEAPRTNLNNVSPAYSDFSDTVIQIQPTTKFTFQSEHNSVTIDIETGEIETDYQNIEEAGRGAARLFWDCFGQELQRIKAEQVSQGERE
ncbi:hypothetical protein EOM81_09915 [bacterium]|nr:hypothetical protein [bacterium]